MSKKLQIIGKFPSHKWNGTVLEVTSSSGTSSADLKGPKPVKGEDYFTEAEKTEIVNDVIAALPNGGGGSGADLLNENGVIKQEHLPEGYPYTKTGMIDFVEGVEFVDMNGEGFAATASVTVPTVGETYTVVWNGTEYQCIATAIDMDGVTGIGLGDTDLIAGTTEEPSGEYPFAILWPPSEFVAVAGFSMAVMALDGTTELNMQIMGEGTAITKIDREYLPNGYPYEKKDLVLIEEQTVTLSSDGMAPINFATTPEIGWVSEITIVYSGGSITVMSSPAVMSETEPGLMFFDFVLDETNGITGKLAYVLPEYISEYGIAGMILIENMLATEGTISAKVPNAIIPMDKKYLHSAVVIAPETLVENDMLVYNGTEWTTVSKNDLGGDGPQLPEVTTEDNDKFLRVVDGAWAAVKLTDVSTEGA